MVCDAAVGGDALQLASINLCLRKAVVLAPMPLSDLDTHEEQQERVRWVAVSSSR